VKRVSSMMATAREVDTLVGRRLRKRRESLAISQGRLARHLGLTFSQVQRYEKGANRIGAGRLYLLADLLGVPIWYFFEGLGEASSQRSGKGNAEVIDPELALLNEAFLSIASRETRESILALVLSLLPPANRDGKSKRSEG
jgi:transcriptional regulator with XRE-family HTH domain